jgi:xylulokinase
MQNGESILLLIPHSAFIIHHSALPMHLLGIDVGSSSVKAAILRDGKVVGRITRAFFRTRHDGVRVEVEPDAILKAIEASIADLGRSARGADAVALAVMSPAWVAMDAKGKALTPIVTHQDRRSVEVARALERSFGQGRHLRLAGNRPFPGGIASTTWAWYLRNEPNRMRRADLAGNLNTFLHRRLTGARVTDPSNASFMGLYRTLDQSGWSDELCDAVGAKPSQLPEVRPADAIGGRLTTAGAARLGLTEGLPVAVGIVDTSAAMLLTGARPGQLLNVCGSTDVLGLCTDRPRPHEKVLTRALGVGRRWMSVCTLAAAASAIYWVKRELFADWSNERFVKEVRRLGLPRDSRPRHGARRTAGTAAPAPRGGVAFEPYLAGERTSIDQRRGAFTGLTLATTRAERLAAVIESLVKASAERLTLLDTGATKILRTVVVSGGAQDRLDELFHRDWPGRWNFRAEDEATLRGLGKLVPRE